MNILRISKRQKFKNEPQTKFTGSFVYISFVNNKY